MHIQKLGCAYTQNRRLYFNNAGMRVLFLHQGHFIISPVARNSTVSKIHIIASNINKKLARRRIHVHRTLCLFHLDKNIRRPEKRVWQKPQINFARKRVKLPRCELLPPRKRHLLISKIAFTCRRQRCQWRRLCLVLLVDIHCLYW